MFFLSLLRMLLIGIITFLLRVRREIDRFPIHRCKNHMAVSRGFLRKTEMAVENKKAPRGGLCQDFLESKRKENRQTDGEK